MMWRNVACQVSRPDYAGAMKPRFWLLGLLFTVSISSVALDTTKQLPSDGFDMRLAFTAEVQRIFQADDYAQLEKMADELRRTKARFPEGIWKLTSFYHGLYLSSEEKNKAKWKAWFNRIDAWKQMFPNSITAPVVEAKGLTGYAWLARGGGFAHTVTEECWRLFRERLGQAQKVLETAARKPARCPVWYEAMQTVALGQCWDREKYDRLFKEAVSKEPTYYEYYFRKAYYLEPKWHGEPGDVERFAEEAAKVDDPDEGMTIYTRIAWSYRTSDNLFRDTEFKWSKMKQGFLDIEKSYPNSTWNLNAFCRYACAAGDKETARALFKRIGDHPNLRAWDSPGQYEAAKHWAFTEEEKAATAESFSLKASGKNLRNFCLAFAPDGKHLAAGYEQDHYNGLLTVWDLEQRKSLFDQDIPAPVRSVAYSPHGNLLAVGIGSGKQHEDGMALIWETTFKDEKQKYILPWQSNSVYAVHFSPNGKKLGVSGGVYTKVGKVCLWDYINNNTVNFDWAEKRKDDISCLQFTPDGNHLITPCNRSISVCDLTTRKELWPATPTLKQWVNSLEFSPDGKVLAAGCFPGDARSRKGECGEIVFWDVSDWKLRPQKLTSPSGCIYTVVFSPDGRYVLGGGDDGTIHIWEISSGKLLKSIPIQKAILYSLAFSPNGKYLAAGFIDGTIQVQRFSLP